jgi:hypothetical protein
MNNCNRPPKHLKLRDGGQPLPGAAPGPLAQGPMSSQFWGAVGQGIDEHVVQPVAKNLRDFNTEYPVVNQIAQVVNQPYNLAVGVPQVAGALAESNYPAAGAAALSMLPFGKFAQVGSATARASRHLGPNMQNVQSVRNVGQKLGLVGHDAGAIEQAAEMGQASYDQTTRAMRR